MQRLLLLFLVAFAGGNQLLAQPVKAACYEERKKDKGSKYPLLVKTCFVKNVKLISTAAPDAAGKYFLTSVEVLVKTNGRYIKTSNSNMFNSQQAVLLDTVNQQIRQHFSRLKTEPGSASCLSHPDSIPVYKMDDFQISFEDDEVWFNVHWGLPETCKAYDVEVVKLKLNDVMKYIQ